MNCAHCKTTLNQQAVCCDACGWLVDSRSVGNIECGNEMSPAVGLCMLCAKPVCSSCAVERNGKIFCEDPGHAAMFDHCRLVYIAESEFESDLILRNNKDEQLEYLLFPLMRHPDLVLTGKSLGVRVFVRREVSDLAINHLKSLDLLT